MPKERYSIMRKSEMIHGILFVLPLLALHQCLAV